MQLSVALNGEPVLPGSMIVVPRNAKLFVTAEGVPSGWTPHSLEVRCEKGAPSEWKALEPPGVDFVLPKGRFWKPQRIEVSLRDIRSADARLWRLRFHSMSLWNPTITVACSVLLLLAAYYLTLTVPSLLKNFQEISRIGLGGLTLSALFLSPIRTRIVRLLHYPVCAVPLALLSAAATLFIVLEGSVVVNRTAETIVFDEPLGQLEPGQSKTRLGDVKYKKNRGYCEMNVDENCEPMREKEDLPLSSMLLRRREYGCAVATSISEAHAAWKESKSCQPSLLQWKTDKVENAIKLPGRSTPASGAASNGPGTSVSASNESSKDGVHPTWTVACQPKTDGKCEAPKLEGYGLERKFAMVEEASPIDLRLPGTGLIVESFVPRLSQPSDVIVPFPNRAVWAVADVELGGRKIGESLLYPSPGPQAEPKSAECWLLKSDEHLGKLVFLAKPPETGLSRFLATDQSVVAGIPMCWHGKLAYVEVYFDQDWSPRDGWTLTLPSAWAASSVRLYWPPRGYWGAVASQDTSSDETGSVGFRASGSPGYFKVQLHRVTPGGHLPRGSLNELVSRTQDSIVTWSSQLANPEWFWTASLEDPSKPPRPPETWESKSNANVSVRWSPHTKEWRSFDKPGPCYFLPSGRRISSGECGPEDKTAVKGQYRGFYPPNGCGEVHVCTGKADQ
jgi:hypothetical protein